MPLVDWLEFLNMGPQINQNWNEAKRATLLLIRPDTIYKDTVPQYWTMGYSLETGTPLIRYVLKAFAYKIGMRKYDIELLEAFASAGFDFSYKAFKLLDYDNYLGQWVDQEARGNALDYFLHHQHRYHHYGIFTETLIDWNDKTAQWANEKAQTEEKQWALNRYLEIIDQADKNMLNLFENNEKTNPAPGFYEVKDFVSYKINDLSDGSHYIKAKRLFREYF